MNHLSTGVSGGTVGSTRLEIFRTLFLDTDQSSKVVVALGAISKFVIELLDLALGLGLMLVALLCEQLLEERLLFIGCITRRLLGGVVGVDHVRSRSGDSVVD